jgi:Cyclin, N-terminal domain
MSEKFSRFPLVNCGDLECNDTLDTSTMDTDMPNYFWKTPDRDFLIYLYENDYNVNPYYLESLQPYITSGMRSLLLDWVIEICSEFFLKRETCYKAISYIDRYLSVAPPVRKEYLQLLGLTACYTACKIEEISVPRISDFSKSAGNIYSESEIKAMERQILRFLQWKILQPTTFTVCDWLMVQWDNFSLHTFGHLHQEVALTSMKGYKKHREITQLIDASTLDINILKYKPRIVAACACYLVLFKHFKQQKYRVLLTAKETYFEEFEDEYAGIFMELYLNFLLGALEIQSFDEVYPCGVFLSKYMDIQISYESPNICKNGLKPETHFQSFLGFQTYNPVCIQSFSAKSKGVL